MYLIYGKTDIGKKRSLNQDIFKLGQNADTIWAIVCDGLGGENAGEVASYIAVNAADRYIKDNLETVKDQQDAKELVINSVNTANNAVIQKAEAAKNLEGMSTTIVCLLVYNNMLHVANVGDSRAYAILNDKITQITKDHSVVQALLDSGKISKEQAENHPNKNVILRAVGTEEGIDVDLAVEERRAGDLWLICSDGLYDMVSNDRIAEILRSHPIEQAADMLLQAALDGGGSDNISLVLVKDREGAQ